MEFTKEELMSTLLVMQITCHKSAKQKPDPKTTGNNTTTLALPKDPHALTNQLELHPETPLYSPYNLGCMNKPD
jgi:hypothetical protein